MTPPMTGRKLIERLLDLPLDLAVILPGRGAPTVALDEEHGQQVIVITEDVFEPGKVDEQ